MVDRRVTVLLVNPVCLDERLSGEDAAAVPMGLYAVGAFLMDRKVDVALINLAVAADPMDELRGAIQRVNPLVIGFSVLNATRFSAMEGARLARSLAPEVTVVFGGAGATFLTDHLFDVCPELDYCVIGEGEVTLFELAGHVAEKVKGVPGQIQGLAYRDNGQILRTPPRKPIHDLDTLPHPGRWFDCQHVSLSRGCPGRCRFCGSPDFWGRGRVRFHSARWFVDHLTLLTQRGITHFFVSDDTFTMDRERVMDVCRLMVERRLSITWAAISRVDFIDQEMLQAMRKAGCIQISFGVESGSAAIRKTLGKPVKQERILQAFTMTARVGILPRAYFIYGSPGETRETIQESIDLMLSLKPLSAIFYVLVIFPGTGLYNRLKDQGRISDDIWKNAMEDIPWAECDPDLDFNEVAEYGQRLRHAFYSNLHRFAAEIDLLDDPDLYPFHADFLSRLAMTFSHGDYAGRDDVMNPSCVAEDLFRKALSYSPDPRAYLGLGMLFQKQRRFDRAVAMLGEGLERFPGLKNLNLCLAVCLMNLGRFSDALSRLEPFRNDADVQPYIRTCLERKRSGA